MEHIILTQLRAAEAGVLTLAPLLKRLDPAEPVHQMAPLMADGVAASIRAAIALIEAWANGPADEGEGEAPAAAPDDGICRHPQSERRSTATMTKPRAWLCRACGFNYEGEPDA